MEYVILVDEHDKETGAMEKLLAHQAGMLHRAISVFIFNSRGEMLLQQRAAGKYHSPLLWTNTCCSHPRPGESVADAAQRRLSEEMGMTCALTEKFTFIYKVQFANGLIEHELDHVFIGVTDAPPHPDAAEVAEWKYVSLETLGQEVATQPAQFTEWFRICLRDWKKELTNGNSY